MLHVPPKPRFITKAHDGTSQKTAFFTVITVKTLNPTNVYLYGLYYTFHSTSNDRSTHKCILVSKVDVTKPHNFVDEAFHPAMLPACSRHMWICVQASPMHHLTKSRLRVVLLEAPDNAQSRVIFLALCVDIFRTLH
jgi:hypothetical protein